MANDSSETTMTRAAFLKGAGVAALGLATKNMFAAAPAAGAAANKSFKPDDTTDMNPKYWESTREDDLKGFIGKHFIYTYDNGWQYEFYIKSANTVDYRIHSGLVGGRWVRDQKAHIVRLSDDIVKISWHEPTGTSVSLAFVISARKVHGVIFFPQWVVENPRKTVCFQNEHLDEMKKLRDAGKHFPAVVIDEFASITYMEECGANNEEVIHCGPEQLPKGYAERHN